MKISVAMATYNGESFILHQLNSIIDQLGRDDEIVICDDGSSDNTLDIIENLMRSEKRIKLHKNRHRGVVKTFEDAIKKCENDVIFLSDQDDIWKREKVVNIKKIFETSDSFLVLHNAVIFSEKENELKHNLINKMEHGVYKNLLKSSYWGCCMAFRRELVEYILPFPNNLVAHDQWIGLIAESKRKSAFLNEDLIEHRLHNSNVSRKLTIDRMFRFRMNLLFNYHKFRLLRNFNMMKRDEIR